MDELAGIPEAVRKFALERFRLLQPHLEQCRPLRSVAVEVGIPFRTAQRWAILQKMVILILIFSPSLFGRNPALVLQVSNETAPPGGWVQIKVSSATPQLIATGGIAMSLDPTVFGPIAAVAVFSANGDAYGMARLVSNDYDRYVDAEFNCGPDGTVGEFPVISPASKGIGQVRGLPILVITVPVLASASLGRVTMVSAQAGRIDLFNLPSPFLDPNGNQYDVSFTPGSVTVGGSLSVQDVVPGGGHLPAGTVLRINGTGFNPSTIVRVDGVKLAATQFVGSKEIDVALGAPADLTGKRFLLRNPDGAVVEYFSFLRVGAIAGDIPRYSPIFPEHASSTPILFSSPRGGRNGAFVVQNPNLVPADVTITTSYLGLPGNSQSTVTIPAGGTWGYRVGASLGLIGAISSSQPIRALQFFNDAGTRVSPGIPLLAYYPSDQSLARPLIGSIVNAASQIQAAAIAPGEILTIYGTGAGSLGRIGFPLNPSGSVATNYSGAQVLFDGRPAPLLYSSASQTNVIARYEIANQTSTNVSVVYNGMTSAEWGIPVEAPIRR